MIKKLGLLVLLAVTLVSCQFSETMVLNEDGTGRMSLTMDMSEMMAMMPMQDTLDMKMDSVMSFKQLFEEKKDSIATLPREEQERLKLLENYQMRILMDPEKQKMEYEIFTDFKSVAEANNLMEGLNASETMGGSPMGNSNKTKEKKESQEQPTAVKFTYENSVFKRDAYIKDPEAFAKISDSIQSLEAFMEDAMYTIKYTFPKKIKSVSIKDAKISSDGKTVTFQKPFLAYMKNPDELDVEIILEKN
ncbi:hypothetical protein [Rasiella sp. SM2506]|uniref:hypothetical protein n=1 Tax=Rasiella sp. SM2506 TaxID=3423914 RepID=UPI003D7A4E4D